MKIKFESDDALPLGNASVLGKNGKYYPQLFLHKFTYDL